MNKKRILCLVLAVVMVVALASGCGKEKTNGLGFESDMPKGEISYPIDTDEKLTYWVELPGSIATDVTNFAETNFAKNLMEKTGVEIEYMHPAAGSTQESFQLMMASGKTTDMIQNQWLSLGPQDYVDNKQIYALNDVLNDYAPNLKKFLDENEDVAKIAKTEKGYYYSFPFVREDEVLLTSMGWMLRSDWLEEAGLDVPETIEDWDKVLEAFKKRSGVTPFATSAFTHLSSGFGTFFGMYVNDGEIVYGPLDGNKFENYVAKLNEWFEKGYIDKNYLATDDKTFQASLLNDKAGIYFGSGGGNMGSFLKEKKGEAFDLTGVPFPTDKRGEPARFGVKDYRHCVGGVAISTTCKNPALAARFLDYGYTEEGHMTYNFGKEGESYNLIDGYPTYVEEITNNTEGKSMSQMLAHNCLAGVWGPFTQDKRYIEQFYGTDQQRKALDYWSANKYTDNRVPPVELTTEEKEIVTSIMNEINTYANEMFHNFVTGREPMENYSKFVKEIENMGIDEALEIYQGAYERYLKK